jgi:membrane-associated phospholipid phosphatase
MAETGYAFILFLQQFRSGWLDALFHGASFLGEEQFYLVLVPLLYWHVDKRLATRFAVLFLVSVWLNTLLKSLVAQPRPSPERVAVLSDPGGGGVPSGHAQNAVVSWGLLALHWRQPVVAGALVLLILLIAVRRMYLGVHFPHDVAAGFAVGALLLAAFLALERPVAERLRALPPARAALAGALAAASPLLFFREPLALSALATLTGVALTVPFERAHVAFDARASGAARTLLRFAVGMAGALLIWQGLRGPLLAAGEAGAFFRYALLGAWVAYGAPWLFVRLGLARVEPAADSSPQVVMEPAR